MALFTESELRNRVRQERKNSLGGIVYESLEKGSKQALNKALESQKLFSATKTWDIFLSHSTLDSVLVEGMKLRLEDLGYSVYIDWIEDPELDRSRVTKSNVRTLKRRMNSCNSLFYAYSVNAINSKWMPWELGYFDGSKGKAAILPIASTETYQHSGTEFLGVYPYMSQEVDNSVRQIPRLWVNETEDIYIHYDSWMKGILPYKH